MRAVGPDWSRPRKVLAKFQAPLTSSSEKSAALSCRDAISALGQRGWQQLIYELHDDLLELPIRLNNQLVISNWRCSGGVTFSPER